MSLRGKNGVWGPGRGPLMMMKDSLFVLISNVVGGGMGLGRGPSNEDEGFFVSADFKCLRKGVWGCEGAH